MSKKPTLFFLLPSLSKGGAEKNIVAIANFLSRENEVHIGIIRQKGDLQTEVSPDVEIIDLGGQFFWVFKLIKYSVQRKPCLILSTFWDVNLILCIIKPFLPGNTKLIFREAVFPSATIQYGKMNYLSSIFYRYFYHFTDASIVLSNSMKHDLASCTKIKIDKIYTIHNAVLENIDSNISIDRNVKPQFVSCGRLCPQKGFEELIQSFSIFKEKYPNHILNIIGTGPLRSELEKRVKKLALENSVLFLDYIEKPYIIFQQSDLYILSSHYEGVSNAMLEALSVGLPVLATEEKTSANEFIVDGVNGFLIPRCSTECLLNGMYRAVNKLDTINRKKISIDVKERFSYKNMLAQYNSVINNFV